MRLDPKVASALRTAHSVLVAPVPVFLTQEKFKMLVAGASDTELTSPGTVAHYFCGSLLVTVREMA